MTHNLDNLAVAIQLIRERGEDAVAYSRARWVELIAANHHSGATFWRAVLKACEAELARRSSIRPPAGEMEGPKVHDHVIASAVLTSAPRTGTSGGAGPTSSAPG